MTPPRPRCAVGAGPAGRPERRRRSSSSFEDPWIASTRRDMVSGPSPNAMMARRARWTASRRSGKPTPASARPRRGPAAGSAASFQFSRDAAAELADILAFVAERSPSAAMRLRDALLRACVRLAAMPGLGHTRADLTSRPVRFWPVFSYLLVYDPTSQPLRIVALIHAARDVHRALRHR